MVWCDVGGVYNCLCWRVVLYMGLGWLGGLAGGLGVWYRRGTVNGHCLWELFCFFYIYTCLAFSCSAGLVWFMGCHSVCFIIELSWTR